MALGVFLRILIAVIALTAAWMLIPPLFRVVTLPLSADVTLVLHVCLAVIAVFYILRGPKPTGFA